ncbi:MAG TPA: hypothetical protein VGK23_03495 [Methanomassiliicoccales archaeon]|jgi:hypothetical protein
MIDGSGIEVSMEGAGSANVTVRPYISDPVSQTPFIPGGSFVDLRLGTSHQVDMITLRFYFDPQDLPSDVVAEGLHLHWWNGDNWSSCSNSGVDTVANFVWVKIGAGTRPSLSELNGTVFGTGTACIALTPDTGVKGTYSLITGSGLSINSSLQAFLGGVHVGDGTTDGLGNIRPFGVVIPQVLAGTYNLTVVDGGGISVTNIFTVLDDTPIVVTIDVGSIHFPSEVVSWYATTTINGHLIDVDTLNATLYAPDGSTVNLSSSSAHMSTGVYMISTTIPLNAVQGDHALVLTVSSSGTHIGASVAVFSISPTLSGYEATLSEIRNNTATVITTVGSIRLELSNVNATISSIQGKAVEIHTELGGIHATVDQINASVVSINGSVVRIRTDIGYVNCAVKDIHAHTVLIQGRLATVQTDLGYVNVTANDVHARVVKVQERMVTIETDLGSVNATLNDLHAQILTVTGGMAAVQTDLGSMNVTLNELHAQVITILGTTASLMTDVGFVNTSVDDIRSSVIGVVDGLIQINTTLGIVQIDMANVNTKIDNLNGTVVTIRTDIGQAQIDLTKLNAGLEALNGTVATIHTSLGQINASISDIRLRAISLEGDSVILMSTLGTIQGNITEIIGTVATVNTDLGKALVEIGALQDKSNGIDSSTLIAAGIFTVMAIIILMVVIVRTKKK